MITDKIESKNKPGMDNVQLPGGRDFRLSSRLLAMALFLLVLATFANAISGQFVYDDLSQELQNSTFGHWDRATLQRVFSQDFWATVNPDQAGGQPHSSYYRPVLSLTLMLVYEIAGYRPGVWHMVVILLHALASVLLLVLLDKLLALITTFEEKRRWLIAGLASAIFAIHPVQCESVAWISEIVNPLSATLMFSAFYQYLKHRESFRVRHLVASLALFGIGLLTKEINIGLLPILAACEFFVFPAQTRQQPVVEGAVQQAPVLSPAGSYLSRAGQALLKVFPFICVSLGYMALRYNALGTWVGRFASANYPDDASLTLADNLITLPSILVAYMKLILVPVNLSILYDVGYVKTLSFGAFWFPLALTALVLLVLVRLSIKEAEPAPVRFALVWIIVTLAPHLNTRAFLSDQIVQDHYLYLPIAGVGLLFALLIARIYDLLQENSFRPVLAAVPVLLLICLAVLSVRQNKKWSNEQIFWENAAAHAPRSRLAHLELGRLAEQRKDLQAALSEYDAVLQINPNVIDALNNKAFVYWQQGRRQEAAAHFEQIASLTPGKAIAHFNLSVAYGGLGRYQDAERELRAAIEMDRNGPHSAGWKAQLERLQRAISQHSAEKPDNGATQ